MRTYIICVLAVSVTFSFGYITDSTGVPMRDGIKLGSDLYFPIPLVHPPPWPTLLQRTPYDRGWDDEYLVLICDVLGYALIEQNLRGYGDSEGEPNVFRTDGWGELQDGYDAIEWIAEQWWSNDDVGMLGASAHGMTQYYAAGALPPHLVCCAPMVAAPALYRDCAFTGGEFRKALVETWLTAQGTPWLIDSVCNHPNWDSTWWVADLPCRYDVTDYPMFHIDGWYDLYTDGVLDAFSELQSRFHHQKMYIGPWSHGEWGERQQGDLLYPENAQMDELSFLQMTLDWYNYWLHDSSGNVFEPRVLFYLMGDCDTQDTTFWNHWVEADTWPLPTIEYKSYYLRENGLLDTLPPQIEVLDTFQYNPLDPCTTYGGREYIGLDNGYGPINQNPIENRTDVLVYSTPVLDTPLTVIGKLKFVLYASSDCYDTDWTVRVTDVYPDGRSILMTDGILMARHRYGFDREDSLVPGEPDTFHIDLWSTANVFNTGHQLRVIISSSNYPRFEKNPNTGAPFRRDDSVTVIATQSIYRSPSMPSHLLLPVLPEGSPYVEEWQDKSNFSERLNIDVQGISSRPEIRFCLTKSSKIELSLYDIVGRRLWKFDKTYLASGNYRLKLPKLSCGVYFIHSKVGTNKNVEKIVVIK